MYCNQIFSLLQLTDAETATYTIQNVIVAANFEVASRTARTFYGDTAIAVDTTQYPIGIGGTYKAGTFYDVSGNAVKKTSTGEEQIAKLEKLLEASDEAVTSLYEMQTAQEEINIAVDEAIAGLYEMLKGGE